MSEGCIDNADDTMTGEKMMEEYVGKITPGALSSILHQVLIQGCNVDNPEAFKGGYFSDFIVWSKPVLSWFRVLADSPSVTPAESAVFNEIRDDLETVMTKEERKEAVSKEEMTRTFNSSRRLAFLFQNDQAQRNHAQWALAALMANYHGDLYDEPAMLLHFARDVLFQGVDILAYMNRLFKGKIYSDTDVLVALDIKLVPDAHKKYFEYASKGAKKLRAFQLDGLKLRLPFWINHMECRHWLEPLTFLFDMDAEARGMKKGEWHVLAVLGQVYSDSVVQLCLEEAEKKFGPPKAGGFFDKKGRYDAMLGDSSVVGESIRRL